MSAQIIQFVPRNYDPRTYGRAVAKINYAEPIIDLTMLSADPEDDGMPSDSAYSAPPHDGA